MLRAKYEYNWFIPNDETSPDTKRPHNLRPQTRNVPNYESSSTTKHPQLQKVHIYSICIIDYVGKLQFICALLIISFFRGLNSNCVFLSTRILAKPLLNHSQSQLLS